MDEQLQDQPQPGGGNHMAIIAVLIALVVILMIVLAVYITKDVTTKEEVTETSKTAVSATVTPKATATPAVKPTTAPTKAVARAVVGIDTSDWTAVVNKDDNYTLKHPGEWHKHVNGAWTTDYLEGAQLGMSTDGMSFRVTKNKNTDN